MKRFITRIGLVFGAVLVANLFYVVVIGGNLRSYVQRYRGFDGSSRLVVLGDSHANRAWSVNSDARIYNFAYGSDNVADMRMKLEHLASVQPSKSLIVVLSFEPHLISPYRELKNNNRINRLIDSAHIDSRLLISFPLIFDPNTELDTKLFFKNAAGFGQPVRDERKFSERKAIARYRDQFGDGAVSEKLLGEYQKLIDRTKILGWQVIAIKYPVHPFFDSLVRNRPESLNLMRSMDSLATQNNLIITDFSNDIKLKDLFMDQDHLNIKGSKVFLNDFLGRFKQHLND